MENKNLIPVAVIVAGAMLSLAVLYSPQDSSNKTATVQSASVSALEEAVLPSAHILLPVSWGDLGTKLISAAVIYEKKIKTLFPKKKKTKH